MQTVVTDANKNYLDWGNLADTYRWTHHPDKALYAYRKAISLANDFLQVNPSDTEALSSSALYYAKLGDRPSSFSILDKALALAPEDNSVLFDAAVVCELAGQRGKALTYFKHAIANGYSVYSAQTEPELAKLRQDTN